MRAVLSRYLASLFGEGVRMRTPLIAGGVLFTIEAAALLLSGQLEGTFYRKGGVGVLQTSNWLVAAGDWALIVLIFLLTKLLWEIPSRFPAEENETSRSRLADKKAEIQNQILLSVPLRSNGMLLMLSGAGFLFFLYNYVRMSRPDMNFPFDMFDTIKHPIGFVAVRFILSISWILLLPYLAYVSLITLISFRELLLDARKPGDFKLRYNFSHPDRHGGFIFLSRINVYFVLCLLVLLLELLTEILTVPVTSLPMKLMLALITVVFLWITFWFMRPASSFLKESKTNAEAFLTNNRLRLEDKSSENTNVLVKFDHIKNNLRFSINTYWSALVVNGVRAASIVGTVYKFSNLHGS
jgi:hypothetical protein